MASFTVRCTCGEQFHVDESNVGRQLKCRRCGSRVEVKRPAAEPTTPRESPASKSEKRGKRRRRRAPAEAPTRQPLLMPSTGMARLFVMVVWAYLGSVILIAVLMWGWGDRMMLGTVLLFMGRWVFLVPLLVLVPLAIWSRPVLVLPLIAAALIVVGPIMGFRTGWRRLTPRPAGTSIRVVTYNAGMGSVVPQLLPDLLNQWQAQVVAFQECGELLAAATRLSVGWYQHESKDLCLLSRFPIRGASVMDRSTLDMIKQSEVNELGGAGYVVRFVLDGPLGPIRVANLHLETPRKGLEGFMAGDFRRLRLNTGIRETESHLARGWVDAGRGPLLVLGDFNTPVESRIFQQHWGDLADAHSTAGTGFGVTKYNGWIRARIDHVLASSEWRVDRARVGEGGQSDHRPLIVDLTLKTAGGR